MDKKQLRQNLLLEQRVSLENDYLIFKNLLSLDEFKEADLLLTYISKKNEIDTRELLSWCFKAGKRVAVPRIIVSGGVHNMVFYEIGSFQVLEFGKFGISEPLKSCKKAQINRNTFCVVPALACDSQGFRLGRGGGYYDRFLAEFEKQIGKTAALCYSENIITLPVEAHDKAVNFIITEGGVVVA